MKEDHDLRELKMLFEEARKCRRKCIIALLKLWVLIIKMDIQLTFTPYTEFESFTFLIWKEKNNQDFLETTSRLKKVLTEEKNEWKSRISLLRFRFLFRVWAFKKRWNI